MRLKSIAVLSILAIGFLAVQPSEAQAQFRRFDFGFRYYNPGPYYYPPPATYSYYYSPTYYTPAVVTPYVVPSYPSYNWSSGYYQVPARVPIYGSYYYQQGLNPYGVPYYGGFYQYRR